MISQSTLYTIGLLSVVIVALQYITFMVLRKMVRNDINKIARKLLKNNSSQVLLKNNKETTDNNEDDSVDIDTPTQPQIKEKENIKKNTDNDSYVNPIPSIDNDNIKEDEEDEEDEEQDN